MSLVSRSILESKGMHAIFQKKGKKGEKIFENIWKFGQKYKIWKYFEKGQVIACDYHTHKLLEKALSLVHIE